MKKVLFLSLLSTGLVLAKPASAQQWPTTDPTFSDPAPEIEPNRERLGRAHQVSIGSDFTLSLGYSSSSYKGSSVHRTAFEASPQIDYFLFENFSLGGAVFGGYEKASPITTTTFGVRPRIGYNIQLSQRLSFFPKIGIGWHNSWATIEGPVSHTQKSWALDLPIHATIVFQPFTHFFIGLDPSVSLDLVAKSGGNDSPKTTTVQVALLFGGWF